MINIGFIIVRKDVVLPSNVERPYCGADRMPVTPSPLDMPKGDAGIAWNLYEDLWERGIISRDRAAAELVLQTLLDVGERVELIYADMVARCGLSTLPTLTPAEIAVRNSQNTWFIERGVGVASAPLEYELLGLDVCTQGPPFHSAIYEPGPGLAHDELFESHLNGFGLIDDKDVEFASTLMNAAASSGYSLTGFHVVSCYAAKD